MRGDHRDPREALAALAALSALAALLPCALLAACGDPSAPGAPAVDLEGPRGYVETPGPWLVRAAAPAALASGGLWLEVALTEDPEQPPAVERLPLIESARPDVHLALLPAAPEGVEVRYVLRGAQAEPLTAPRSFTLVPADPPAAPPAECRVTLVSPDLSDPLGAPLSARDDTGQEAGVQVTFVARYAGPGYALVRLSLGGEEHLAATRRGEAALLGVRVPAGLSELRLEAFGERAARCALEARVALD